MITREVLIAAKYFGIDSLISLYEKFAFDDVIFDNITETLLIAEQFEMDDLIEKCFDFLEKNKNWRAAYLKLFSSFRKNTATLEE